MLLLRIVLCGVFICSCRAQCSPLKFPNRPNTNCQLVVIVDNVGCRQVQTECGLTTRTCEKVGEILYRCSGDCEPTCSTPFPICSARCFPTRCQCRPGLFRDEFGDCVQPKECHRARCKNRIECVLDSQCTGNSLCIDNLCKLNADTQICGPKETFKQCRSSCEPTCKLPNRICTLQCLPPGCQCSIGYYRHNGECVLLSQCPSRNNGRKCGRNEVFRQCGTECEPTCSNRNPICTLQCAPPSCQCSHGYYRQNGNCISARQCSYRDSGRNCVENEEFLQCRSQCEPTCEERNPICNRLCLSPGCQCSYGYYRYNGNCVHPNQCDSCSSDRQCFNGQVCVGNRCVHLDNRCNTNRDCAGSQICRQGSCVRDTDRCFSDRDCFVGQRCRNGQFKRPGVCATNVDCPHGQKCNSGSCINREPREQCQRNSQCDRSRICINGICRKIEQCRRNRDCDRSQECIKGQCRKKKDNSDNNGSRQDNRMEDAQCQSSENCIRGRTCRKGQCIPTPVDQCAMIFCRRGRICANGQCIPAEFGIDSESDIAIEELEPNAEGDHQVAEIDDALCGFQMCTLEEICIFDQCMTM